MTSRKRSLYADASEMFSKKRAVSVPMLFDLKRIQNLEYHNALSVIKPLVEQNLIRLTKTELPFGVAFRVPEHEYLGISMGRDNLHGTPIHMSYVDDLFKIPPCITQTELSCFLHNLYPQWYASNRNTAFIYIDPHLNKTHYRQMPIASFGDLHFLRLTMPVNALKSSLKFIGSIPKTWNEVMVTPPNILESLRAITDENTLSLFIDDIFHQDNLTPIDAVFIQALNELCVRLNVKCKTYYKIATKISICGEFYTESKFHSTRWYRKVFKILKSTGGVIGNIIDVNAFFIAVAHVDIITPLSLQYMFLRFVDAATSPMEQPSELLMQQLKQLCSKENLKQSEIADIVEQLHATDDSDKKKSRIVSLMQSWSSYNVLVEVKTNEHNFGIMNTALTRALIQFFQQWYLKEVSVSSEGDNLTTTTMFHALVNNIKYVDIDQSEDALNQIKFMQSSYGNVFRHSSKEPDFEFALCLNILLNHLYSGSNAGYYMGQVMCKDIHGSGMLTTMNAELTIPQGLNYDPKINYTVRTVRKLDNGYETGTDSEGGRRRKKTINIKQRRKRGNKTKRFIQQKKIKSHRKI